MNPMLMEQVETIAAAAAAAERAPAGARGGIRPGIVFVPCTLCRAPVDATTIRRPGQPRLCARHKH
jgi:hypothetical protein